MGFVSDDNFVISRTGSMKLRCENSFDYTKEIRKVELLGTIRERFVVNFDGSLLYLAT